MLRLQYQNTRDDYWHSDEDPHVAQPVWLGAFRLEIQIRCASKCGSAAVARATWLYRGKSLVLELCKTCCQIAYEASQHKRVRIKDLPPPKLLSERATPMPNKKPNRFNAYRDRA